MPFLMAVSLASLGEQAEHSTAPEPRDPRLARIETSPANELNDSDWRLVIREIRSGRRARFVPLLARVVGQADSPRFSEAVYQLGEMGAEAKVAVPVLLSAFKTSNEDAQYGIAQAIRKIGPAAAAAVPTLVQTLQKELPRGVRIATTDALSH